MRATAPGQWADRGRRFWLPIAASQMILIGGLAAWFAFNWAPEPISDWLLYWNTAGNAQGYERGGLGLWMLAAPKSFGAPPHAAAFALNMPAALWLGYVAYRADPTRWRVFAQLVVAYLLLITPYFGIVQLDLLGTAALATGIWWLLDGRVLAGRDGWRLLGGTLALAVAVSTRPQFALILWALIALLAAAMLLRHQWRERRLMVFTLGLLAGSVAGFCIDMGLRQISGRTEQIRTSSAVTLYAGLLVSSDNRAGSCGYWTVEAGRAAREDLGMSMAEAVGERLSAQSPAYWARVLACKAPQIVAPPAYAFYWFAEAPNLVSWRDGHPERAGIERLQARVYFLERVAYRALGGLILILAALTALRAVRTRQWAPPLLLSGWVVAFWAVHAVFEIQGRYFLGFYLLIPILCGLLWRERPSLGAGQSARTSSEA